MSVKDGGPAFPSPWHPTADGYQRGDCGMSLRDYLAGHAPYMPDELIANAMDDAGAGRQAQLRSMAASFAKWAYVYADAMLAEREPKA